MIVSFDMNMLLFPLVVHQETLISYLPFVFFPMFFRMLERDLGMDPQSMI
jgi:hypothetical protein